MIAYLLAAFDSTITVGTLAAVATITAGAVAATMRLKGETRVAIEAGAEKRISEAQLREQQLLENTREWREQWQAEAELRRKQDERHQSEVKELRGLLDQSRSDLATAQAATDISGLEDRMNERFDLFLHAQEQQTAVLQKLIEMTTLLVDQVTTNGHGPPS